MMTVVVVDADDAYPTETAALLSLTRSNPPPRPLSAQRHRKEKDINDDEERKDIDDCHHNGDNNNNNNNNNNNGHPHNRNHRIGSSLPPSFSIMGWWCWWCPLRSLYYSHLKFVWIGGVVFAVLILGLVGHRTRTSPSPHHARSKKTIRTSSSTQSFFPPDFVWGAATSSYQIEGAVHSDGRGLSVWDTFIHSNTHTDSSTAATANNNNNNNTGGSSNASSTGWMNNPILDHSTADISCDHYHLYELDVQLFKNLQLPAYRFSIAWSRIVPTGRIRDGINAAGVNFYHRLLDLLLQNQIEPYVTLFHWDTPQGLEESSSSGGGGWLNRRTAQDFADFANFTFATYGSRVKYWITVNEPWTVAVNGYSTGIHAPGRYQNASTEPYLVGHHLLLAHALATNIYREHYQPTQGGWIGIANAGDFRYPFHPEDPTAQQAATRAMEFQLGWFLDPLWWGRYPHSMRELLGSRLPTIKATDRKIFRAAIPDFVGLNYYSSLLVSSTLDQDLPDHENHDGGYWSDLRVAFHDNATWRKNDMGWSVVPDGLREMLHWISDRYHHPAIYITENGSAEAEPDLQTAVHDEGRRSYLESHLRACAQAIHEGVVLKGYFAWSIMDNFEWQFGYQRRFGLHYVDFDTLERTPKSSAIFYRDTIIVNGANIDVYGENGGSKKTEADRRLQVSRPRHRPLPSRVLMGYADTNNLDAVYRVVQYGTNILSWKFANFVRVDDSPETALTSSPHVRLETDLDINALRLFILELDTMGYGHVVHLMSVGGWNAPHLDPLLTAEDWYDAFLTTLGDLFHGIDWDLEGNDLMDSPYNIFTMDCLDKMGEISHLAHDDGFVVSMAPPQSYLDVSGSHAFSRFVNLTDNDRHWHTEFSYYGHNVYAYLLQRYGDWVDLVSIQFYESYSRAAQAVYVDNTSPQDYLITFVRQLVATDCGYLVQFSHDEVIGMDDAYVTLPLSKLLFGLANGWTYTGNERTLYISPEALEIAWKDLEYANTLPRGFMYWVISEEIVDDFNFSRRLGEILSQTVEILDKF